MVIDSTSAKAPTQPRGIRIWLYSSDGEDAPVLLDSGIPDLGKTDVLWADVDLNAIGELQTLWAELGIEELVEQLHDGGGDRPAFVRHDGMLHLTVNALDGDTGFDPMVLHCVVGPNWIVTLHQGELDLVDDFNKPFHGETELGGLSGPDFLSLVLDWQISGYFRVIEELQSDIDELDEELLTASPGEEEMLRKLHQLRTRVRHLRNTLSPHREVLGLLSHPRSDAFIGADSADEYRRLEDRLHQAIESLDTVREMIVGSFDIFMTRTAQATNDIMKRLTLVSVLLLPAAVLAGVMGMNFRVAFFDLPWMFWVTIVFMAGLAGATILVARRRGWL
jgi:magnesium/cobalt transport protein CorA